MLTDVQSSPAMDRPSPGKTGNRGQAGLFVVLALAAVIAPMRAHALVTTISTSSSSTWHDSRSDYQHSQSSSEDSESDADSWSWTKTFSFSDSWSQSESHSESQSESQSIVIAYSHSWSKSEITGIDHDGYPRHDRDPCTVSQVPLPAGFPLLLSALGLLGLGRLIGKRRSAHCGAPRL